MDRISNLPDSVMENIVERLSQIDRVRTGALSSKWRFLWTRLPSLALDWYFYHFIRHRPLPEYLCIINSLILQCRFHVRDLSLVIRTREACNFGVFDHLIVCSLWNGLERLSIETDDIFHKNPYRLPSSYFTSDLSSIACLTHLKLSQCEFSPPVSFQGFPTLVSLELRYCQVTTDVLSRFVAGCSMLKSLTLLDLKFPNQILDIIAPELRYLCVKGQFKWLFLVNTNSVKVLDIDMEDLPDPWEGLSALASSYFDGMAKLEKISLGGRLTELLAPYGDSLKLARYDVLKSLKFAGLHTASVLPFVANSMRCFPNLTELTISLDLDDDDEAGEKADIKDVDNNYDFKHLLSVAFINITGTRFWMKLIEHLLRCSPALKLMSIEFDGSFSDEKVLRYVRQITKFSRASSTAKIDI